MTAPTEAPKESPTAYDQDMSMDVAQPMNETLPMDTKLA